MEWKEFRILSNPRQHTFPAPAPKETIDYVAAFKQNDKGFAVVSSRSRIQYLLYLNDGAELIDGERVAAASSALQSVTELLRSLLAEAEALRERDGR